MKSSKELKWLKYALTYCAWYHFFGLFILIVLESLSFFQHTLLGIINSYSWTGLATTVLSAGTYFLIGRIFLMLKDLSENKAEHSLFQKINLLIKVLIPVYLLNILYLTLYSSNLGSLREAFPNGIPSSESQGLLMTLAKIWLSSESYVYFIVDHFSPTPSLILVILGALWLRLSAKNTTE